MKGENPFFLLDDEFSRHILSDHYIIFLKFQVYDDETLLFYSVLSSIFRKNISAKMKSSAGKSGEGAAKPRLFAL